MSTPETPSPEPTTPVAETRTGDVRLLLEQVVKAIVDSPDEVIVTEVKRSGSSVELELEVAQKDIGKVIGKQGRTIRSLRTLAQAAGVVQNLRCNLELLEEDELEGDEGEQGTQGNADAGGVDSGNEDSDNEGSGNESGNVDSGNTSDTSAPDDDDNIGNRA